MLKELTIGDTIFLYECLVKGDVIEYNLFESDENWTAVKSPEEVTQTLQLLNKRIKYNVDTAYDTLQYAHPESANWAETDKAIGQPAALVRVLQLKYRIKGRPFNFEWHLKKQDNSLCIQLPVNQVVGLVEVLPKQIEELLDVLRRKEDEILQYRREYGNLRRSTLATKAFDMAEFREQYANTDITVKSLQKIIARWRAANADTELEPAQKIEAPTIPNKSSPKTAFKKEEEPEASSPSTSKNVQESPRNRKRKAMQAHKAQLTRTLKTRKVKLEYESQSQSLSENEQVHDNKKATEVLTNGTATTDAIDEAFENAIGALEAIEGANERENDVGRSKEKQLLNGQDDKPSTAAISPISKDTTKESIREAANGQADKPSASKAAKAAISSISKDTTKEPVKEAANAPDYDKSSTSKTTRAAKSPICKDTSTQPVKEPASSKIKRTSPRFAAKPNTRLHLRECATPDNSSSDLILFENPNENIVYTVDESVEPVEMSDVLSVLKAEPTQVESNKCTLPILNSKYKVEQPRNDISSYVDSVLNQLDAFDKELKAQFG